jgi:hypothetical protein
VSADIWQIAMVDELGMVRTQVGPQNTPENGCSAWDALYDTAQKQQPVTTY